MPFLVREQARVIQLRAVFDSTGLCSSSVWAKS
jgi:hypothetical protein